MKEYYCVFNKNKEPIVIFNNKKDATKFRDRPNYLETKIQKINELPDLNQYYQVEQPKGTPIGLFLKPKDASEFLKGEFYSKKIFSKSRQIL